MSHTPVIRDVLKTDYDFKEGHITNMLSRIGKIEQQLDTISRKVFRLEGQLASTPKVEYKSKSNIKEPKVV